MDAVTIEDVRNDAEHRARARSEAILAEQYEKGRKVLERHAWAMDAFRKLATACPDVDDADLVRLFRNKRVDDVHRVASNARLLQYNAAHRGERQR